MSAEAVGQRRDCTGCSADVPAHIEDVLARDGVYIGTTAGVSMWPMLRNRRDTIVVERPSGRLKRFDVALYRRGDAYVLHRVVAVQPHTYTILGDNCLNLERGVCDEQVIGVLTGFFRGDRQVDMSGAAYRAYVRVWHALYPLRRVLMWVRGAAARGPVGDIVRALRGRS